MSQLAMIGCRRLGAATLAVLAAVAVAVAPPAQAGRHGRGRAVRLAAPARADVPVDGLLTARLAGPRAHHAARVMFRLDHRRIGVDRRAPFLLRRAAAGLPAGTHGLDAVAVTHRGRRLPTASRKVTIGDRLEPRVADPEAGGGDARWARGRSWASSFETGDFTEWSWWGQDQGDIWGHIAVVDPASAGVPSLGGARIARFETTPDDIAAGRDNAKLYRSFGTGLQTPASRPPTDVSGIYATWLYLPPGYHVPAGTSVNLFQFKEQYRTASGSRSDPLWWVQLGPARWADGMSRAYHEGRVRGRADAPVAFINHQDSSWRAKRRFVPVPLGRWVSLVAVVRQHRSIDFYLDGRRLDTARAAEYPVSPFHGAASEAWVFGIGNYSTGANGPLYADRASFVGF